VGEDVTGVRDKRGIGEAETVEMSREGFEVEAEPRVAAKVIEVDGVWRDEGELVQSGSVEMRREVAAVSGRLLW
jgi:hypothetical protein